MNAFSHDMALTRAEIERFLADGTMKLADSRAVIKRYDYTDYILSPDERASLIRRGTMTFPVAQYADLGAEKLRRIRRDADQRSKSRSRAAKKAQKS